MNRPLLLRAANLVKSFSSPEQVSVLEGVSLDLKAGDTVAITGRSGSGKSTLLHILSTLEPSNGGELWINGELATAKNAAALRNRDIGFVFQAFHLLEDFTALENVLMPSLIGRAPYPREKGLELLGKVGLEQRADFPVRLLSGGERQRVAIARALCNDPKILFADEPTGNLDQANADLIGKLLFDLVKDSDRVLVLVTHDEELSSRCNRQYKLAQGLLTQRTF